MNRAACLLILLAAPGVDAYAQHAEHGAHEGEHDVRQMPPAESRLGNERPGESQSVPQPHTESRPILEPSVDPPAGHDGHAPHGTTDSSRDSPDVSESAPTEALPDAAFWGPEHAADTLFGADAMAAARELLRWEHGGFRTQRVLANRVETRTGNGDERLEWDLQGWYGGDLHKLWWKSEGRGELGDNTDDAEVQLLYSRAVTPYFDFQAGVRHDFEPSPRRSHAVLGVQGLLPYVFEIDAAAFVSEEGDVTGRFEAEYDLRIWQRVVLQPRVELDFSAQSIPELAVGSGLGSIEGGFRLRYEIRRELAPYIGIGWERKTGATADFAREAGEDLRSWELVAGVRAWF